MADIKKELNDIKNAVYGREVRSSIHDGIKKINEESEESKQKAEEAHEITQDLLDETFDSAALEANFEQRLNDEIANLQPEWTGFKNDVTTRLAHIPNQIASAVEPKADKTEVEEVRNENKSEVQAYLIELDALRSIINTNYAESIEEGISTGLAE